jgi:hypothetical protein
VDAALLSLAGSIIGGVLVLAGQHYARRAEERRHWLTRFQETAGDLSISYLQEGAQLNDARRSGRVAKDDLQLTTYTADRQRALGRFLTLPWAPAFEEQRRAMGGGVEQLWAAWDAPDEEFRAAYDRSRAAVRAFTTAVGELVAARTGRG